MSTRTFGTRVQRNADPKLLKGEGSFTDDIPLEGVLHSAFVRSPFARAKINRIDISEAEKLDGVLAVYTCDNIGDLDIELPMEHPDNMHAYYIYVVAHPDRDEIISSLSKKNIHLNISYPWPIHIMEAYKHFVSEPCTHLKKTEENAKKIFSLPMYPTLTDEEQGIVIKELKQLI